MKLLPKVLSLATFAVATLGVIDASADGTCIEDKARQALACTGVAKPVDAAGLRTGPGLHGVLPSNAKSARATPKPPTPAASEMPRDERKSRLQARARFLVNEIQGRAPLRNDEEERARLAAARAPPRRGLRRARGRRVPRQDAKRRSSATG